MNGTTSSPCLKTYSVKEYEFLALHEFLTEFNDPYALAADLRNIYYKLTSYLLLDDDFLHGDRQLSQSLSRLWALQEVIEDIIP